MVNYELRVQPPTVNITIPNRNPFTTNTASINLSAVITNITERSGIRFSINGRSSTAFDFVGTSFTANNIGLNPGRNTIAIMATNQAGRDSKSTVIVYNLPVQEPAVRITTPTGNPTNTQGTTAAIKATILNVDSRSNVTFKVNGQSISNFSFSGTSFTANGVALAVGNNTITISGSNSQGTATASTVIVRQVPLKKPSVRFLVPNTNPATVGTATTNVTVNVTQVSSKNDIVFTVNGRSTGFNFSGTTLTANGVRLAAGNNTLKVVARNGAGEANASTVIVYQTAQPPRVTITAPRQNPFTTTDQRVNINATILEVASKSDIRFQVNGQPSSSFNFSGTSFTAPNIALRAGSNTISIMASNRQGRDSKSTVVIYQPPVQEPTVRITAPSSNPFNTQVQNATINATITNVSQKSDVGFSVNGRLVSNFRFTGTSFVADNVALQAGNNTFTVTGSNASGTATATTTVIYTPFVPRPTVSITNPATNPTRVVAPTLTVRATVQNVSNRNNVALTINGRAVTNFLLSGTSLQANGVTLNPGSNSIIVTATNSAGTASDTKVVLYQPRNTTGTSGGNNNQTGSGSSGGGNTGSGSSSGGGSSGGSSGSSGSSGGGSGSAGKANINKNKNTSRVTTGQNNATKSSSSSKKKMGRVTEETPANNKKKMGSVPQETPTNSKKKKSGN